VSSRYKGQPFYFPFLLFPPLSSLVNNGSVDRCEKHGDFRHHRPPWNLDTRFRAIRVTFERNFAGLREWVGDCAEADRRPHILAEPELQYCAAHGFSWQRWQCGDGCCECFHRLVCEHSLHCRRLTGVETDNQLSRGSQVGRCYERGQSVE
jgi:hypothetical protein